MKARFMIRLSVLLLIYNVFYLAHSQTISFNVSDLEDGKNYVINISPSAKTLNVTSNGTSVIDKLFFGYWIDNIRERIGLQILYDVNVDMDGTSDTYFIVTRDGLIVAQYEGNYYLLKASNDENHSSNYNQLINSIQNHISPPNGSVKTFTVNDVSFNMIFVEGGTFMMGNTNDESDNDDNNKQHKVKLSDYHIGQTEVTQELWQAVMGNNPSWFNGNYRPVEEVNWNDCQDFIRKLNSLTGQRFRLPTEAEWEFAAKGGTKSKGYKYSGSNNLDEVAWYEANSGYMSHNVGTKSPNELGLYDMSGNVYEWCQDWYDEEYYQNSPVNNPQGPSTGERKVCRGGCWHESKWKNISNH